MGRFLMKPVAEEGLQFGKLMGSGRNFGLVPDFSTYVFLGVWENPSLANAFLQTATYRHLLQQTEQTGTIFLQPQRAHGLWDGRNPFAVHQPSAQADSLKGPVAILTRATIRAGALVDFWRHVPQARQHLTDHRENLLFGIGVGEVPLSQQCTLSVWRTAEAVDQYAYRQRGHREIVRLTRQRQWYREELFARFTVLQAYGTLFADVQHVISGS